MLGEPPCDEPEASTGSLRAVAEEQLTAVGDLDAPFDVGIVNTGSTELVRGDESKIHARPVALVGDHGAGHVAEVVCDLGADLVAREGDRWPEECPDRGGIAETLERAWNDARREPSPSGVYEAKARRCGVDQKYRDAVSDEHGERAIAVVNERVGFARGRRILRVEHVGAVDLSHDDEMIDAEGPRDEPPVFRDRARTVANVVTKVEGVVGGATRTVKPVRDEGVNAERTGGVDRVDGERSAHLGVKVYVDWHVAQCPMTSRAWEVAAKPSFDVRSATIAATVRSNWGLGVTSMTLPHSVQRR